MFSSKVRKDLNASGQHSRRCVALPTREVLPFGLLYLATFLIVALMCRPALGVNTGEILSATSDALSSCLKWRVVGECFWLRCGLDGCSVKVSAKVAHYRPDSVVSVYVHVDQHPWRELRTVVRRMFRLGRTVLPANMHNVILGGGTAPSPDLSSSLRNVRFFEADVIGHPLVELSFHGASYICKAVTRPLIPYFLSLTDAVAWRSPEMEQLNPNSLVPGRREIGNWPSNTWGSVYPRTGWISQPSAPKAAAVAAQRAADVAINGGTFRVRDPFGPAKANLWPPTTIREHDASTAVWQMLHPRRESSCDVFGKSDLLSVADWGGGRLGKGNAFAWNLWRPYKCCARRGQRFLGSDDFRGYP